MTVRRDQRRWTLTWKEGVGRRASGPTIWPGEEIEVMPVAEHQRLRIAAQAALDERPVSSFCRSPESDAAFDRLRQELQS